jgi:ABC-type polysaccharide/polyol phosphate export systems, permease component
MRNIEDVRYVIPFGVQFWMFCTPIVYPTSLVPEQYRIIYAINPMVGIIEGFRSALLGTSEFPTQMVLIAVISSTILFAMGSFYYKQMERYFADVI